MAGTKNKFNWINVLGGVLIGAALIAAVTGAWYYYVVFLPGQQKVEDILRMQEIDRAFRAKYCQTTDYVNDFARDVCTGKISF